MANYPIAGSVAAIQQFASAVRSARGRGRMRLALIGLVLCSVAAAQGGPPPQEDPCGTVEIDRATSCSDETVLTAVPDAGRGPFSYAWYAGTPDGREPTGPLLGRSSTLTIPLDRDYSYVTLYFTGPTASCSDLFVQGGLGPLAGESEPSNPGRILSVGDQSLTGTRVDFCDDPLVVPGIDALAVACNGSSPRYQWYATAITGVVARSAMAEAAEKIDGATGEDYNPGTLLSRGQYRTYYREARCACGVDPTFPEHPEQDVKVTVGAVASNLTLSLDYELDGDDPNFYRVTPALTGGVGDITYTWSTGASTREISVPSDEDASISLSVRDVRGCSASASVAVEAVPQLQLNCFTRPVSCYGATDGYINSTVSGGVAPYRFEFDDVPYDSEPNQIEVDNLPAGQVIVTVVDARGRRDRHDHHVVGGPAEPIGAAISTTPFACDNSSAGSVTVVPRGGWPGGYTISLLTPSISETWLETTVPYDPSAPGPTFDNLLPPGYGLIVRDGEGCPDTSTFTIERDDCAGLSLEILSQRDACVGEANGEVTLASTDDCGFALVYEWFDGDTRRVRDDLPAGTHAVTVTNSKACNISEEVAIGNRPTPTLTTDAEQTTGPTGADGVVKLFVDGGSPPFAVYLEGVENASISSDYVELPGLLPGVYDVRIESDNGCGDAATVELTAQPCRLSLDDSSSDDVTCAGAANGRIRVRPTGSNDPSTTFAYTWTDVPDGVGDLGGTDNPAGLVPGDYTVRVRDASGCTVERTFTIAEPAPLEIAEAAASGLLCGDGPDDGAIRVTTQGGNGGYRFAWTRNGQAEPELTSAEVSDLRPGTYRVVVTDREGCADSAEVRLVRPPTLTLAIDSVVNPADLSETFLTAQVTGGTPGIFYDWNDGEDYLGDDPGIAVATTIARTYTVTATDINSCTRTRSLTVNPPPPIEATFGVDNASCFGEADGRVRATVTGGLLQTEGSPARDYELTWRRDGGSAPLPGRSSRILDGIAAGEYVLSVTDATGTTRSFRVDVPGPPTALSLAASDVPASCERPTTGRLDIEVGGGWGAYDLRFGDSPLALDEAGRASVEGLAAGLYALTLRDSSGCRVVREFEVGGEGCQGFAVDVLEVGRPCESEATGAIRLAAADPCGGELLFDWADLDSGEPEPATRTGLTAGDYSVTVRRASNPACAVVDTVITVEEFPALRLDLTAYESTGPLGADGAVTVRIVGPAGEYAVTLDGEPVGTLEPSDSLRLGGLLPGTYGIAIAGPNGCTAARDIEVESRPCAVVLHESGYTSELTCFRDGSGRISVVAAGGVAPYDYTWDDTDSAGPDRGGLPAGTYAVRVTGTSGCDTARTFVIAEPPRLAVSLAGTDPTCGDDPVDGRLEATASGGTGGYRFAWSHDADLAGPIAGGLGGGSYVVTVTDANGCVADASITLVDPEPLALAITGVLGAESPARTLLTAAASGGTAPLSYRWEAAESAQAGGADSLLVVSSLLRPARTYVAVVTDARGCTARDTFTVAPPPPFGGALADGFVSCRGGADGRLSLADLAGGFPPYSYTWTTAAGDPIGVDADFATDLVAGDYRVRVTDRAGQDTTFSAAVLQPERALTFANFDYQAASCELPNSGSFAVTPEGGWGGYTLSVDGGPVQLAEGQYRREGVAARVYFVELLDARGCRFADTVRVTNDGCQGFDPRVEVVRQPCDGEADGLIALQPVDACGDSIVYFWDDVPGVPLGHRREGLVSRTYIVTADRRSNTSCTVVDTVVLRDAPAVTLVCAADSTSGPLGFDGAVRLSVAGPAGGYALLDSAGLAVATLTIAAGEDTAAYTAAGLGVGVYGFSVVGPNDCGDACSAEVVSRPCGIDLAGSSATPTVACASDADGRIEVIAAGGVGPYRYTWADSLGGAPVEGGLRQNLPPGTYPVSVADAVGCFADSTFTIAAPEPLTLTTSVGTIACGDVDDGLIEVAVGGGTRPYRFAWSHDPALTVARADSLAAGSYRVEVVDTAGCRIDTTVVLDAPDPLRLALAAQRAPEAPATTRLTASVTGGTPAFTYRWRDAAGDELGRDSTLTVPSVLRPARTYFAAVRDAEGCATTDSLTVVPPPPLTAELADGAVSCFDGADGRLTVTGVGGGFPPYRYSWTTAAGDYVGGDADFVTDLAAGEYRVRITDLAGQDTTLTASVVGPEAPLTFARAAEPASCERPRSGAFTITPQGGWSGYVVRVDGDEVELTEGRYRREGVAAGAYFVELRDERGCLAADTLRAGSDGCAGFAVEAVATAASCTGEASGSLALRPVDACGDSLRYRWLDGTGAPVAEGYLREGLAAGTYVVEARRAAGGACVARDTLEVSEAPPVTLGCDTQQTSGPLGRDGAVRLTIAGPTGTYSALDSAGGELARLELAAGVDTIRYRVDGLPVGEFRFSVIGPAGCTDACVSRVESRPCAVDLAAVSAIDTVACYGDTTGRLDLRPRGGVAPYSFDWADLQDSVTQSGFRQNLPVGRYTAVVVDAVGCADTTTLTIAQPDSLTLACDATLAAPDGSGGAVTATAGGGTPPFTFRVAGREIVSDEGSARFDGVAPGVYEVEVRDAGGCTATCTTEVIDPCAGFAADLEERDPTCGGIAADDGRLEVVPTAGTEPFAYRWSHDSTLNGPVAGGLAAGAYSVGVTDANGCEVLAAAELIAPDSLSLAITADRAPGTSTFELRARAEGGRPPYTVTWSDGGEGERRSADGLATATYRATVRDSSGCKVEASYEIVAPPALAVEVEATAVSCYGATDGALRVAIRGGVEPYRVEWDDGAADDTLRTGLAAGSYPGTLTDGYGVARLVEATVAGPESALRLTVVTEPATCAEPEAGRIAVEGGGGWGGHTLTVDGDTVALVDGRASLTGLRAGSYALVLSDARGCDTTARAIVEFDRCAGVAVVPLAELASCPNERAGVLEVAAVSDCGDALVVDWADLPGDDDPARREGLAAGDYEVSVRLRDDSTCSQTATLRVAEAPGVTLICEPRETSGPTATDGQVRLRLDGPAGYILVYLDGELTDSTDTGELTVAGLTAGDYAFTARGRDGGCDDACVARVEARPCTLVLPVLEASTSVSCAGAADGTIRAEPSGGVGPYTYRWSDGAATEGPRRDGLAPGRYTLTALDVVGCEASVSVEITEPSALALACTPRDADPESLRGTVEVRATGGTPPYSVSLDGTTWAALTEDGVVGDVRPGEYSLTLRDAAGCRQNCTGYIAPAPLTLRLESEPADCYTLTSGSVSAEPGGGVPPYELIWTAQSATGAEVGRGERLGGVAPGSYVATLRDALGDERTARVTVAEPLAPEFSCSATEVSELGAADAAASLTITAGVGPFAVWRDGVRLAAEVEDFAEAGLAVGSYSYEVIGANGCRATCVATVAECSRAFAAIGLTAVASDEPCTGGGGGIEIGGPDLADFEYSLDGDETWTAEPRFDELIPGNYEVLARSVSAGGCRYGSGSITVGVDPVRRAGIASVTPPSGCDNADGEIVARTLGQPGEVRYSIDDGATWQTDPVFTGVASGQYFVTFETVATGCRIELLAVVEAEGAPAITQARASASTDCFAPDGTIELGIRNALPTTRYRLGPDAPWQVDPFWAGLPAGTYTPELADSVTGCTAAAPWPVAIAGTRPAQIDSVEAIATAACAADDGAIAVTARGEDLRYSLDGGATWTAEGRFDSLAAGDYELSVMASSDEACVVRRAVRVLDGFAASLAAAEAIVRDPLACAPTIGAISVEGLRNGPRLSLDGGLTWTRDTAFTDLAAGSYELTVAPADGEACTQVFGTYELVERASGGLDLRTASATANACGGADGELWLLAPESGVAYTVVVAGDSLAGPTWRGVPAGEYRLLAADPALSCRRDTVSVAVAAQPPIAIELEDSRRPSCYGAGDGLAFVTATGGDGDLSYTWGDGRTGPELADLDGGPHVVVARDGRGCADTLAFELPRVPEYRAVDSLVVDLNRCGQDSATYDLSAHADSLAFVWTLPSGEQLVGPRATTYEQGEHVLTISSLDGCAYDKPFEVAFPDIEAPDVQLLVAGQYQLGSGGLVAFEASPLPPDSLRWVFADPRIEVVEVDGPVVTLEFAEVGTYEVGMAATFGECEVVLTRTVQVIDGPVSEPDVIAGMLIRDLSLYPNPNPGRFYVDLELRREASAVLEVMDPRSRRVVARQIVEGASIYEDVEMNLPDESPTGGYLLVARAGGSVRVVKLVRG